MRNVFVCLLAILSTGLLIGGAPEVEFFASLDSVSGDPASGELTLTVNATSSQTIDLIVDEESELEDSSGDNLTLEELAALPQGTVFEIEAVFTEAGLYAEELEIVRDDEDFEIYGQIEAVDEVEHTITVWGLLIYVPTDAEIESAYGDELAFEDLEAGQFVKVKGEVNGLELWASEIEVGVPGEDHLLLEFDGVIETMMDDEWLVTIEGDDDGAVQVLVVIDGDTQIYGEPFEGAEVEIKGVLTDDLKVLAKLVEVEDSDDFDDDAEDEGEDEVDGESDDEADDQSDDEADEESDDNGDDEAGDESDNEAEEEGDEEDDGSGDGAYAPDVSGEKEQLALSASTLRDIVYAYPDTPLADKIEDVLDKVQTAFEELAKMPPDRQAAVGNLEGAVGDLEAVINDELLDIDDAIALINPLVDVARSLASAAISEAVDRGGDPYKIGEAQASLAYGDSLRASGYFKDAVAKYKDALAQAEGA